MHQQEVIENTVDFVKSELKNAEGGHDWFHIERVWKNAKRLAKSESGNLFIIELGALVHDIGDHKFGTGDESEGRQKVREFLTGVSVDEEVIAHVEKIMENISFKGGNYTQAFFSPELAVVQDADRLDALGAIGIARAFNYGGFKGRELYNPGIKPLTGMTVQQYTGSKAPTLNHFYEKLLLLRDRMNTPTGRQMADQRHRFMEEYLDQFLKEWNGEG